MAATFNSPVNALMLTIAVPNEDAITTNFTLTRGITIIDTWTIKTGGAGGAAATIVVSNAGVTVPTIAALGAAGSINRATAIATASASIASGGVLRTVSTQNANDTACTVCVSCIPF